MSFCTILISNSVLELTAWVFQAKGINSSLLTDIQ